MALVQKRDPKKTMITVAVVLLVALGGGLTYWFITREAITTNAPLTLSRDLPILSSFGTDTLRSARVQNLKSYGNLPVEPEPFGKANPFEQNF